MKLVDGLKVFDHLTGRSVWVWQALTGRTSVRNRDENTGSSARFSRPCGAVVPIRAASGLPSPNSRAAERVREFLASRPAEVSIVETAEAEGRDPKRFYQESDGSRPLSWDFVDRRGAALSLEDRLMLGRWLMDRWGLRVEVGPLPTLGA